MPNVFDGNTFADVYKDDYVDSDGYHRVLFNSGRALQARELTQLQTILQNQITSFGENIYLEGASVNPKSAGMKGSAVSYVKIARPTYSGDISDIIGTSFRRVSNNGTPTASELEFRVSHIIEYPDDPSDSGYIRIYGRYVSDGTNSTNTIDNVTTPAKFVEGDELVDTLELAGNAARYPTLTVHPSAPLGSSGEPLPGGPNTGFGFIISTDETKFFTQGHFVIAPKQSIVAAEYESQPNLEIGFEVVQDIVTVDDTTDLYDNQGVRPNLSSPGADRFRIRLLLTTRSGMAADSDGTIPNYLHYATIRNGVIIQLKEGNENYNQIEKRLAARTDETNGDFIVNPFLVRYEEGPDVSDPAGGHGIDRISEDTMIAHLPTPVNSQKPLAYLDGYRLEHQVPKELTISKPLSTTVLTEVETSTDYNNFVSVYADDVDFGKNLAPFIYIDENDLLHHRKTALVDDNETIGTARVKSIRWFGTDSDAYRVHLYDIQMDEGKNFRNVRRIAQIDPTDDPANYDSDRALTPQLQDGQLYINDAITNSAIFPISGGRVKKVDDVTFTVQRYFIQTTAPFTIGTNTVNQNFDNVASWILLDESTDRVLRYNVDWQVVSGGDNSSSVSISVDGAFTGPFHIYAEVEKNSTSPAGMTHTTKNYKTHNFMAYHQGVDFDDWMVEDTTSPDDKLYDGVKLLAANLDSANGPDVLPLLEFDGGQRDNYYAPVTLRRKGLAGNNDLHVKVGYFKWSAGDYLCANSYVDNIRTDTSHPDFDSDESPLFFYSDIPSYTITTNGLNIPLEDAFDFRSRMNPRTTETPIDRHHLPLDDATIRADVEYYNSRIDTISLGYNQNDLNPVFSVHSGTESLNPTLPEPRESELPLFTVKMQGNTKNTEDLLITPHRFKGFKMRDIDKVEQRVARLEETTSLSFLENNAANLVELDTQGNLRSKTGFFVDDFTRGFLFTSSFLRPAFIDDDDVLTESLQIPEGRVMPKLKFENINMLLDDSDTLAGSVYNAGYNTKLVGDQLYLDYVEVLDESMKQEMISWYSGNRSSEEHGWYNVNPYNVFVGEGHLNLSPSSDNWQDTRRLPNNIIDGGTTSRLLNASLVPRSTTSTFTTRTLANQGDNFRGHSGVSDREEVQAMIDAGAINPTAIQDNQDWFAARGQQVGRRLGARIFTNTTTTVTRTQTVQTRVIGTDTIFQDLGDRVVATHSLPWARSRMIYGKAEGLRPNTRFWPFFDGIDVTQWCVQVTQQSYTDSLRAKKHLEQPQNSANVSATAHPDAGFLSQEFVSDYKGDIFFEFLLPNNAKLPGNNLSSAAEWSNWIEEQRRFAKQYGTTKNPEVYNNIGWKFRTGSILMKFLDISEDKEENALCLARTNYTSQGSLQIRQRDILSTRVIISENFLTTSTNSSTNTSTDVQWIDPLAQSFMIDAQQGLPGAFVTKVEVFCRRAPEVDDLQIPLQLQIRDMQNGYPTSGVISSQHRVYKPAEEVRAVVDRIADKTNLGQVLANPVTFELPEPVYLQAGKEYAICLLAECDNYEVYVGTTYGLVLGKTSARVAKQTAMGSLFLSQNGSTWTAKQNQDMAYRIYTAKFKSEGEATFYNQPYEKYLHNTPSTLMIDSDLTSFHVTHMGHGLGVGDRPELSGLDSAASYFGVAGSDLMDPSLTVIDAKINSYQVRLNNGTFNQVAQFGSEDLMTNRAFYIDRTVPNFMNVIVPKTDIEMQSSFITGVSHSKIALTGGASDPRFLGYPDVTPIPTMNYSPIQFKSPQMLAASYMETEQPSVDASIQVRTKLVSEQQSQFGIVTDEDRVNFADGYISDVTPFIDTQRTNMTAVNFLIDNQPREGETVSDLTNTPNGYVPESAPRLGTSPSKHVTNPITLEQAANGLKVLLDMHKPQNATVDVYYRIGSDTDDDLYEKNWIYVTPENSPPNNPVAFNTEPEFSEYNYLIGGRDGDLDDFLQFQLKMVFRSTNTCEIPILKSIRAIALI